MTVTVIPRLKCPTCHVDAPASLCFEHPERTPKPGDVSHCIECAELLVFTPTMGLRVMGFLDEMALPEQLWRSLQNQRRITFKLKGPDPSKVPPKGE